MEDTSECNNRPSWSRASSPESSLTSLSDYEDAKSLGYSSEEDVKTTKLKRKRKSTGRQTRAPEINYSIPDVMTLPTTFKGRLGYACLNTVLRNIRPASNAIFCSRTCRIDTMKKLGKQHAQELGLQNVRDLVKMIQWNEDNNIRFLRISSEMFPFAAHSTWGYDLEFAKDELAAAGELARKYGHRLTSHPNQFTQLGSPRPIVVENSIRDLLYHSSMFDLMGMGVDSVMIIHGGGTYNDKPATVERLKQNIQALPNQVRSRLVLENDEMCFNADDLLPICEELDVPFIFDYHHDWIFPSSIPPKEIIRRANIVFERRGIRPKQHLSSPRPGAKTLPEKRAHANRCETFPPDLPDDVDLMIEAKDKEQAVFHLYRIYQLQPVVHANLRPPDEHETLRTKGRKSARSRRGKSHDDCEKEMIDDEHDKYGDGDADADDPVDVNVDSSPNTKLKRRPKRLKSSSAVDIQLKDVEADTKPDKVGENVTTSKRSKRSKLASVPKSEDVEVNPKPGMVQGNLVSPTNATTSKPKHSKKSKLSQTAAVSKTKSHHPPEMGDVDESDLKPDEVQENFDSSSTTTTSKRSKKSTTSSTAASKLQAHTLEDVDHATKPLALPTGSKPSVNEDDKVDDAIKKSSVKTIRKRRLKKSAAA